MLVIDAAKAFWGGMGTLAVGLVADSVVHLAGWTAAEPAVHWSLLAGMVVALGGVFLRAGHVRKEPVHAGR